MRATCQHHSPGKESLPPIIRGVSFLLGTTPLTPQVVKVGRFGSEGNNEGRSSSLSLGAVVVDVVEVEIGLEGLPF